jgi:inosine-uridine nucleoside N-ribohydrolase
MNKSNVIIDCDTGIDDALALTLACSSDKLKILGVTTVSGNVGLEDTTRNTCNVLNLLKRNDLRVAKGADKPLEREIFKASGVHGVTGLRGYDFEENHYELLLEGVTAWDYQKELIENSKEKVVILALGPLTNIAILLDKYPQVKENIEKIIFMGTSYHCGNPTQLSTFNVLVDPEAFKAVIFSGVEFVACPLDVTKNAVISNESLKEIRNYNTEISEFVYSIVSNCGISKIKDDEVISTENEEKISKERLAKAKTDGASFHDPCTVAYLIDPSIFSGKKYYCDVECKGELTLGYTLIDKEDYYNKSDEERNIFFLEKLDREHFVNLFKESILKYNS